MRIGVVCGLAAEARVARAAGLNAHACGGDPARASALARRLAAEGAGVLVSFGLAGGLGPHPPGVLVVADAVLDSLVRYELDPAWVARLRAVLPEAHVGLVAGMDRPVATVADKAALAATGAVAVDTESHAVARVAGVPFLVVRAIADPADMALPPAALVPLRSGGGLDGIAVARSVLTRPGQLPDLIRLAFAACRAMASLTRAAQALRRL